MLEHYEEDLKKEYNRIEKEMNDLDAAANLAKAIQIHYRALVNYKMALERCMNSAGIEYSCSEEADY